MNKVLHKYENNNKIYAAKMIKLEHEKYLEREVAMLTNLKHPNILRLEDVFIDTEEKNHTLVIITELA